MTVIHTDRVRPRRAAGDPGHHNGGNAVMRRPATNNHPAEDFDHPGEPDALRPQVVHRIRRPG